MQGIPGGTNTNSGAITFGSGLSSRKAGEEGGASTGDSLRVETYEIQGGDDMFLSAIRSFAESRAAKGTPIESVTIRAGSMTPEAMHKLEEAAGAPVIEEPPPPPVEHKKIRLDDLGDLGILNTPNIGSEYRGINHQKYAVIDGAVILGNSPNFSANGGSESLIVENGPIADAFLAEWNRAGGA